MPQGSRRWKLIALSVVVVAAAGAFTQRERIARWHAVGQFEKAADREPLVEKLAAMGRPVVPELLPFLQRDDAELAAATGRVFAVMLETEDNAGPLAGELVAVFPNCPVAGQRAILDLMTIVRRGGESRAEGCRSVAETAMKSPDTDVRVNGVRLAMWPELKLLRQVLPLLSDPAAEVRRASMLALGPRDEAAGDDIVSTEELLHWLHDTDSEVRRLCEMSLIGRGLREVDVRLGKRLTDPDPRERLELLVELGADDAVEPAVWLERLSRDPESAVRASAARVAAERRVEFGFRLDEMSQSDPDGTVRAMARYYKQLSERPRR